VAVIFIFKRLKLSLYTVSVLAALAVPSVTMIGQMFLGCDRAASVTFFTVALTVNGAVCGGYLGNGLDIAPNFSGTVRQLTDVHQTWYERQANGVLAIPC
jgi:hypothetical protein